MVSSSRRFTQRNKTFLVEDSITGSPTITEAADVYLLSKAEYQVIRKPPTSSLAWACAGAALGAGAIVIGEWIMAVRQGTPLVIITKESVGAAVMLLMSLVLGGISRMKHSDYREAMEEMKDFFSKKTGGGKR